jgi:hypothetical protein
VRPAAVLLALLLLPACTGEGGDPVARPSLSAPPSAVDSGPHCPAPPATNPDFPSDVPDVIPKPRGLKIDKVDRSKGNVVQVRTTVPMSLRESVLFIVKEFPKAGFTLSRGDAEATEADAPFQRAEVLRGLVRVFATDQECSTLWLFAVVRNTGAPYDISYTPKPSSTPLPFG